MLDAAYILNRAQMHLVNSTFAFDSDHDSRRLAYTILHNLERLLDGKIPA